MISKNEIKQIQSLQRKKVRHAEGKYVIEGEKIFEEAFTAGIPFIKVFTTNSDLFESKSASLPIELISEKEMERITHLSSPSPVLGVLPIPDSNGDAEGPIVVLDDISDPGNLGTIIRTADWFGVKHIYASKTTVDAYNSKVVQSSMGSIFRMNVQYIDLLPFLDALKGKGISIYAAVLNGNSPAKMNWNPNQDALVIGSESHGISEDVLKRCTHLVTIAGAGKVESLNAAVATGILLHEWLGKP